MKTTKRLALDYWRRVPLWAQFAGAGMLGIVIASRLSKSSPPKVPPGSPTIDAIVSLALTQIGKPYNFGTTALDTDSNPLAFDCSEFIKWVCHRNGVSMPDGSQAQIDWCESHNTMISLADAVSTRGALLFRRARLGGYGHVAMSLGNGQTVEAMNTTRGVTKGDARQSGFDLGALIPGVAYPGRT